MSKITLDQLADNILTTFDPHKYNDLISFINIQYYIYPHAVYLCAYEKVRNLPLSELPKYVNHPSDNIKEIVHKRLEGRNDFGCLPESIRL